MDVVFSSLTVAKSDYAGKPRCRYKFLGKTALIPLGGRTARREFNLLRARDSPSYNVEILQQGFSANRVYHFEIERMTVEEFASISLCLWLPRFAVFQAVFFQIESLLAKPAPVSSLYRNPLVDYESRHFLLAVLQHDSGFGFVYEESFLF